MTRETAADRLADQLRTRVLAGDLAPGTPLREEAVAEEHGLSRHTVRRALERLVAERLLVAAPYRGVRVTSFSASDVVALQELRSALESEAVRLLRGRHGDVWPADVTGPLVDAAERMASADDVEVTHSAFHRLLVASAASPRITEAYERLDVELTLFLRQLRFAYDRGTLVSEHRAYLTAVQREGEAAVRDHLVHATEMLLGSREPRSD